MDDPRAILLSEDNPNDVELTLAALGENRPIPEVYIAKDGEEGLDYLYRRGALPDAACGEPQSGALRSQAAQSIWVRSSGTHQGQPAYEDDTRWPAANPTVVLLDLKLPRVDRLEVLEHIKTDPHMKTIPVVMLTSWREERDPLRSYDLGTNAYVVKPMSYKEFIEVLGEVGLFWGSLNQLPGIVDLDH